MKKSVSNLAWPNSPMSRIVRGLNEAGIIGVEIAPTAVWSDAPWVSPRLLRKYREEWADNGIAISGIQSLLFGHPECQLFDRSTWPALLEHLSAMIRLAQQLDAPVAVFGSPKNRLRGRLSVKEAHQVAAEFLMKLLPVLEECEVVLTVEPNAPAYGADYVTHYREAVALADLVDSPHVQPQVDTGCLFMVGDDPVDAIFERIPAHVHVSAPHLASVPGPIDHAAVSAALAATDYDGWVVLEMLQQGPDPLASAMACSRWLTGTYA